MYRWMEDIYKTIAENGVLKPELEDPDLQHLKSKVESISRHRQSMFENIQRDTIDSDVEKVWKITSQILVIYMSIIEEADSKKKK